MLNWNILANTDTDQLLIFTVVALTVILLISRTLRYDLVAVFSLLLIILSGVLSPEEAFAGLIHPVVLLVASMFILTQGLTNSGLIDLITRKVRILDKYPVLQIGTLTALVAIASAFINNIGALAPMIPIAIHLARKNDLSPSLFLLPLAFGSQLGGYLTLIGTPRNIIVSSFREQAGSDAFSMFDFALVGSGLTIAGVLFLSFLGWRLLPKRKSSFSADKFSVEKYITEVSVPENSKLSGEYLSSIRKLSNKEVSLASLIRDDIVINHTSGYEIIKPGDRLLLKANPDSLKDFTEEYRLDLVGEKAIESQTPEDERMTTEAVVTPSSSIVDKNWEETPLSQRYGVNLLAISRTNSKIQTSLANTHLRPGDVILLHGKKDSIRKTVSELECYPLAERELTFGQKTAIPLALIIFVLAILTATLTTAPVEIVFLTAAFIMIVTNLVPLKQAYNSIKWPILLLIGSMITVGVALQESGGADIIADFILSLSGLLNPATMVIMTLLITIIIANIVNATVSAVIMAPIALFLAAGLNVSVDPFLMAVAIGSTSVFLTAYGHESNSLVMEAGGYTFKDYLRVGLPLEILIIILSAPLILYFWPL
ncbi:MAG: SLC13 family permease [Candidatus Paceibacterota bacterium]